MAFDRQVDDGVEQWMAGGDQVGGGLTRHAHVFLLEADTFVAAQDGRAQPDLAVAGTDVGGDVGHFEAAVLPLARRPPSRVNAVVKKAWM